MLGKLLATLAGTPTLTALLLAGGPAVPKEASGATDEEPAVADARPAQPPASTADAVLAQGSRRYKTCMASAGEDASRRHACVQEEAAYQDRMLNVWYQELMTTAPEPQRAALRERQRAWIRETERDCDATTPDGRVCRLVRTLAQKEVFFQDIAGSAQAEAQTVRGRPDARGELTLRAGDATLSMAAAQCGEEGGTFVCTQVRLRVETPELHGQSLLEQEVLFGSVGGDVGGLYRGSPEQGIVDQWPTFALSDINADGHEDLLVWSGRNGSYGDPSYTWYLFDPRSGQLVRNPAIAELVSGHTLSRIVGNRLHIWYRSGPCERGEKVVELRGDTPHIVERKDYDNCRRRPDPADPGEGATS